MNDLKRDHPYRTFRKRRNMTQRELADQLMITQAALSRIESGKRNPGKQTAYIFDKLCADERAG